VNVSVGTGSWTTNTTATKNVVAGQEVHLRVSGPAIRISGIELILHTLDSAGNSVPLSISSPLFTERESGNYLWSFVLGEGLTELPDGYTFDTSGTAEIDAIAHLVSPKDVILGAHLNQISNTSDWTSDKYYTIFNGVSANNTSAIPSGGYPFSIAKETDETGTYTRATLESIWRNVSATDWHVPTIHELAELDINLTGDAEYGIVSGTDYWSSQMGRISLPLFGYVNPGLLRIFGTSAPVSLDNPSPANGNPFDQIFSQGSSLTSTSYHLALTADKTALDPDFAANVRLVKTYMWTND
jgi:hypothetical protein